MLPLQDTGLMAQLQQVKAVFSEPRQAGDAFDTAIRRFYEAVDGGQGGLFMAVCRGKVRPGRL
jgi:Fanconi anemia group J protein